MVVFGAELLCTGVLQVKAENEFVGGFCIEIKMLFFHPRLTAVVGSAVQMEEAEM